MFKIYEGKTPSIAHNDYMEADIQKHRYSDIKQLVSQAREGSTDASRELLSRLQPLILSVIRRHNTGSDREDLLQEAALAILEGIRDYDEAKGIPFLAYIKVKLNFHIYNICRRERKREYHTASGNASGSSDEADLLTLLPDEREDTPAYILKAEQSTAIREALSALDPRHRQVIILYYFNRISLKDIAIKLGISYKTAQRYKARAEKQLSVLLSQQQA
mgnify:CR=1 FL=1